MWHHLQCLSNYMKTALLVGALATERRGVYFILFPLFCPPCIADDGRKRRRDENNSGSHWCFNKTCRHRHTRMNIWADSFFITSCTVSQDLFIELFNVCLPLCLYDRLVYVTLHRDWWKENELCFFSLCFWNRATLYVFLQLVVSPVR